MWVKPLMFFNSLQETTLADLLQLNLHCFEDEVREIVDKAVKEMGMEKVIAELNSTWTGTGGVLPAETVLHLTIPLFLTSDEAY